MPPAPCDTRPVFTSSQCSTGITMSAQPLFGQDHRLKSSQKSRRVSASQASSRLDSFMKSPDMHTPPWIWYGVSMPLMESQMAAESAHRFQ